MVVMAVRVSCLANGSAVNLLSDCRANWSHVSADAKRGLHAHLPDICRGSMHGADAPRVDPYELLHALCRIIV